MTNLRVLARSYTSSINIISSHKTRYRTPNSTVSIEIDFLLSETGVALTRRLRRIAAVATGVQYLTRSLEWYRIHTTILNEHRDLILTQILFYCIRSEGFLGERVTNDIWG